MKLKAVTYMYLFMDIENNVKLTKQIHDLLIEALKSEGIKNVYYYSKEFAGFLNTYGYRNLIFPNETLGLAIGLVYLITIIFFKD